MSSNIKEENLKRLKEKNLSLYQLYGSGDSQGIEPLISKSSMPVFKYRGVAIHSLYRPEEEAARFAAGIGPEIKKVTVFGLGYGYHLKELLSRGIDVTVIEPCAEIFRSAIDNADLVEVIDRCEIIVGTGFREKLDESDFKNADLLVCRPYIKFFESEYASLESAFLVRSFIAERRPRIMLVGPIYGGTLTTFRYVADALERLGVEVILFDASEFAASYLKLNDITPNKLHLIQLQTLYAGVLGEGISAMADHERPDMVLAMAQAPLDPGTLKNLKRLNVPLAFWFVEDFRTMKYWEAIAPCYDYIFTIQQGEFFEKLGKAGAKNVAYLPQAASPGSHSPLELSDEDKKTYGSDISFMGAGYFNRQKFFQGLLDYDFKIWGTEWNLATEVGRHVQNKNRRLDPEEYIKIFNASKINLNLHSSTMLAGIDPVGDFVNPRVFELAACGAFSLVDNRMELLPLMEPGSEVETFSNLSELREKIDYYLAHEDERMKIAKAGRERVLRDHTFERRMEDLLKIIIENEGESFAEKKSAHKSRNLVGKMMEEAPDDPELLKFLGNFDPGEELSLKEVTKKISSGEGALSKTESIFLLVNELTKQK